MIALKMLVHNTGFI